MPSIFWMSRRPAGPPRPGGDSDVKYDILLVTYLLVVDAPDSGGYGDRGLYRRVQDVIAWREGATPGGGCRALMSSAGGC